jgi:cytochrome b561
MSIDSTPKRYHPVHVAMHWLVALLTILLLLVGSFVLSPTPNDQELPMLGGHKMMGVTLGLLMLIRLITRYAFKRPAEANEDNPLLRFLARAVHFLLYAGVLAMLFSGGALSNAYGLDNILKGNGSMPEDLFIYPERLMHAAFTYLMFALVAMHAGAALFHQFIKKDNLMARMWFGK